MINRIRRVLMILASGILAMGPYAGSGQATGHEASGTFHTPLSFILLETTAEFETLLTLLGLDDGAEANTSAFDAEQVLKAVRTKVERLNLSSSALATYRPLSARRSSVIHGESFGKPIERKVRSMQNVVVYDRREVPPQVVESLKRLASDSGFLEESALDYP